MNRPASVHITNNRRTNHDANEMASVQRKKRAALHGKLFLPQKDVIETAGAQKTNIMVSLSV